MEEEFRDIVGIKYEFFNPALRVGVSFGVIHILNSATLLMSWSQL